MNENDLRDCFAMMRAITGASADECYIFAEAMLEARNKKELRIPIGNEGITAVKLTKRRSKDGKAS